MSLASLRDKIDEVDTKIVELLGERASLAKQVGESKKAQGRPVEDVAREAWVLARVVQTARDKGVALSSKDITSVYRCIMSACKNAERM